MRAYRHCGAVWLWFLWVDDPCLVLLATHVAREGVLGLGRFLIDFLSLLLIGPPLVHAVHFVQVAVYLIY